MQNLKDRGQWAAGWLQRSELKEVAAGGAAGGGTPCRACSGSGAAPCPLCSAAGQVVEL